MELRNLRKRIDIIDERLISLIQERLSLLPEIARIKLEKNLDIEQPERERELLKRIRKIAIKENISPELIEMIYSLLIKESKRIQSEFTGEPK